MVQDGAAMGGNGMRACIIAHAPHLISPVLPARRTRTEYRTSDLNSVVGSFWRYSYALHRNKGREESWELPDMRPKACHGTDTWHAS